MDNDVSPNRYQALGDVAGNNNNDDATIDEETMNEQISWTKKLMTRLINGKFRTFKKKLWY